MCLFVCSGPDPGFAKRGGRVSKLRENWLIWPQSRLNLHDLVVKGGGDRDRIGPYLDLPLLFVLFLNRVFLYPPLDVSVPRAITSCRLVSYDEFKDQVKFRLASLREIPRCMQ